MPNIQCPIQKWRVCGKRLGGPVLLGPLSFPHSTLDTHRARAASALVMCSGTLGRLPLAEGTLAPSRRKLTLGPRKPTLGRRKLTLGLRKLTLGRRKPTLGRRKLTLGRRKATLGWRKRAQGRSKLPPRRGQRPRPSVAHAPPGRKTLCHRGLRSTGSCMGLLRRRAHSHGAHVPLRRPL